MLWKLMKEMCPKKVNKDLHDQIEIALVLKIMC